MWANNVYKVCTEKEKETSEQMKLSNNKKLKIQ